MPPTLPLTSLQSRWTSLYAHQLPTLARAKNSAQPHWPVHLDHCFARIILDSVIGAATPPPTPWTAKLKSPAVKNMSETQLEKCIQLGEDIKAGRVDLVGLDQKSLEVRGKTKKVNRSQKRILEEKGAIPTGKRTKTQEGRAVDSVKKSQSSIFTAMGFPIPPPKSASSSPSVSRTQPAAAEVPEDLLDLIKTSGLTEFRQRVLLLLCQIPEGCYSTYLALSNHMESSPRAVGNALRNNPFAPRVPCHRVVAADGGIGGFNGEWGDMGQYCADKVGLLRGEGVRVVEKRGKIAVEGRIWEGYA